MQQNPLFAQTMNQLAASGGNQADTIAAAHLISKNSGGAVNYFDANGNFNPDVFKQAALGYLSPEINQSFKYYANDFAQGLQNEKQQYQSQLASTQLGQQQQSQQFQTQQGSTNQVNTGAGQQMRQSFYNNQNQQLAGNLSTCANQTKRNRSGQAAVSAVRLKAPPSKCGPNHSRCLETVCELRRSYHLALSQRPTALNNKLKELAYQF